MYLIQYILIFSYGGCQLQMIGIGNGCHLILLYARVVSKDFKCFMCWQLTMLTWLLVITDLVFIFGCTIWTLGLFYLE